MNGSEDQPSPVNSQVYRDLFRDKYLLSQYAFVQFLVEHLTDVSRVFEADLQSVLVLAIVGQMGLQTAIRLRHPADGSTSLNFGADPTLRINASSIAEVSGIPRETVRRKLEGLAAKGWVARTPNGLWRIATDEEPFAPARRELSELEQRATERLARFLGQIQALVIEDGQKKKSQTTGDLTQLSSHSVNERQKSGASVHKRMARKIRTVLPILGAMPILGVKAYVLPSSPVAILSVLPHPGSAVAELFVGGDDAGKGRRLRIHPLHRHLS